MHRHRRRHPWRRAGENAKDVGRAIGLFARLMRGVPERALRREYRKRVIGLLRARPDPQLLFLYTVKCAMHYHHYVMARDMASNRNAVVNSF